MTEFQPPNIEIALSAEGGAPEWVQLLPAGPEIKGRDGRKWTLPDAGALVSAFNAHRGPLAIDWEHGQDRLAPQGRPAPAAGWIEALEIRNGQTWGRVAWTEKAKAAIQAREYRFISPTFLFDRSSGNIVSLAGAGLVNRPNLEMVALNSQDEGKAEMDNELLVELGLAENATKDDILAAIKRLKTTAATNSVDVSRFVPRADYEAMEARALNAEKTVENTSEATREAEITRLLNEAVTAGKVAPASKDFFLAVCRAEGGLEHFKAFVASAPSFFTRLDFSEKSADKTQTALNAEERQVLAHTNLTESEYLAAKTAGATDL